MRSSMQGKPNLCAGRRRSMSFGTLPTELWGSNVNLNEGCSFVEHLVNTWESQKCAEKLCRSTEVEEIKRVSSAPSCVMRPTLRTDVSRTAADKVTNHVQRIVGRIYLLELDCSCGVPEDNETFSYFTIHESVYYTGFCDDFGPMNLGMVYKFCELIDAQLERCPEEQGVIVVADPDVRPLTNTVFLLGAYMIMCLQMTAQEVTHSFAPFEGKLATFRDVLPGRQNFHLTLTDCWEGLWNAKQHAMVDFSPGGFDPVDYALLDDPLTADMHQLIPGKLVAMKGPKRAPAATPWVDHPTGCRDFSPRHLAPTLQRLSVRAVVRLNMPEYDAAEFEAAGIAMADLYFPDCTTPPPDVVVKFLMIAEAVPGAVAVHCQAGLGRTGTMIGLYLMKHHGFTARQAIGWLRVVRPGSVIGAQQQYLCDMQDTMLRAKTTFQRQGPLPLPPDCALADVQGVVARVHETVQASIERALAKRHRGEREPAAAAAAAAGRCDGGAAEAAARHVAAAAEWRGALRGRAGAGFRASAPALMVGAGAPPARHPLQAA